MNDNERHQARPQATGGAGAESQGANRRRRRRPRRRATGGQTDAAQNQPNTTQDAAPAKQPSGSAKGGEEAKKVARGRRKAGSRNRRRSPQSQRGGQRTPQRNQQPQKRRNAHNNSRMITRDETSAGGLVVSGLAEAVSDSGEVDLTRIYVALIGRLDRRNRLLWSMPKGHVEPGEDHGATAEREVWEETGIQGETFADLGVIDYWFVSEGVRIHKTVHHHLLRFVDGDLNDEDPEVTEVAWIPVSELIEHLAYADERKLARTAHDLLPDLAREEKAAGRATPR